MPLTHNILSTWHLVSVSVIVNFVLENIHPSLIFLHCFLCKKLRATLCGQNTKSYRKMKVHMIRKCLRIMSVVVHWSLGTEQMSQ